VYTIHAGGPGSGADVEDTSVMSSIAKNSADAQSIAALSFIASETGGALTARTNAFGRDFERIAGDLSSFYSIGYRTEAARVDRQRRLEVRAKNPAYTVRARRAFVDRSTETAVRELVRANLFFNPKPGTFRIGARAGKPRLIKGGVAIPVEVSIPLSALTFLPVGDDKYGAGFLVFIASADKNDNTTEVSQLGQRLAVAVKELPSMSGRNYTYSFDVQTVAANRISIAVVDELSKVSAFTRVEAQP
jgi:hypothetical protein